MGPEPPARAGGKHPPAEAGQAPHGRAPRFWHVALAPWLYVLLPRRAARTIGAARRWAFILAYLLNLGVLGLVVVGLLLWSETFQVITSWTPPPAPTTSATPGAAIAAAAFQTTVSTRTVADVWRNWHAEGPIGYPEIAVAFVYFLGTLAFLVLAWLNLPRVHRSGSVGRSFERSLRAGSAAVGLLTLAIALWTVLPIEVNRNRFGAVGIMARMREWVEPEILFVFGVCATAALALPWLSRAVAALRDEREPDAPPPRCEGCGYNLTHQPADGRCPECGLGIHASLAPGWRRQTILWEDKPGGHAWKQTAFTALFLPRDFYGHTRMRTADGAAVRFAVWNYLLIGLAGTGWVGLAMLFMKYRHDLWLHSWVEGVVLAMAYGSITSFGCWLGHRTVAALVTTWWLIRGGLPDYRWAAKVIAYESVFLWTFCAFWGLFGATLVIGEDWLSRLLGTSFIYPLGMPPEVAVLLGGTLALAAVWLWRYEVAYRQIRWSNF